MRQIHIRRYVIWHNVIHFDVSFSMLFWCDHPETSIYLCIVHVILEDIIMASKLNSQSLFLSRGTFIEFDFVELELHLVNKTHYISSLWHLIQAADWPTQQ